MELLLRQQPRDVHVLVEVELEFVVDAQGLFPILLRVEPEVPPQQVLGPFVSFVERVGAQRLFRAGEGYGDDLGRFGHR